MPKLQSESYLLYSISLFFFYSAIILVDLDIDYANMKAFDQKI